MAATSTRPSGLSIAVEQVTADERHIDLRREPGLEPSTERGQLALALACRGVAQVTVTRAQMDVRHVQQPRHPPFDLRPVIDEMARVGPTQRPGTCRPLTWQGPWRARLSCHSPRWLPNGTDGLRAGGVRCRTLGGCGNQVHLDIRQAREHLVCECGPQARSDPGGPLVRQHHVGDPPPPTHLDDGR